MIAPNVRTCGKCGAPKTLAAFPPRYPWCRRCKRVADRDAKRRKRGSSPRAFVDHEAVRKRLQDGALHRHVAAEFGCALSTVKVIAAKYGLQRAPEYVPPERPEVEIPSDTDASLAMAVEAQKACWDHYKRGQGRKRTPYAGVTADQVIDGMTEDLKGRERWRGRITLLCRVLDMAKGE